MSTLLRFFLSVRGTLGVILHLTRVPRVMMVWVMGWGQAQMYLPNHTIHHRHPLRQQRRALPADSMLHDHYNGSIFRFTKGHKMWKRKSLCLPLRWGEQNSSPSTPELGGTELQGGKPEEADKTPTLCTNCQTTNTSIWRHDPEGQPLCEIMRTYVH